MSSKRLVAFAGLSLGFVALLLVAFWYLVGVLD
jgi:hypothetical protein